MNGPDLNAWLFLAAALFSVGLYGVLVRKNLLSIVISVELMANAANLNLVAFSRYGGHAAGQATALFALALTVAEVVVGLALVILVSRSKPTLDAADLKELKG